MVRPEIDQISALKGGLLLLRVCITEPNIGDYYNNGSDNCDYNFGTFDLIKHIIK